jgi:hypothetical protein
LATDPLLQAVAGIEGVEYGGFDSETKAQAWLDAGTEARSADQQGKSSAAPNHRVQPGAAVE